MFESTDAITIRGTRADHPVERLPKAEHPILPNPDPGPGGPTGGRARRRPPYNT